MQKETKREVDEWFLVYSEEVLANKTTAVIGMGFDQRYLTIQLISKLNNKGRKPNNFCLVTDKGHLFRIVPAENTKDEAEKFQKELELVDIIARVTCVPRHSDVEKILEMGRK